MASGVLIGAALAALTGWMLPVGVPMAFNIPVLIWISIGLMIMGVIGAAIPARKIATVDPVSVIGG